MAGKAKEFRYVGSYANTLASGQPVEPGEFVNLSSEDAEANQAMFDEGLLIDTKGEEGSK